MSVKVLSMVWEGFPSGGSELLAMLALADWSDDAGRCWPSIPAVARKVRLSPDQARRVVHRLIESDFLSVTAGKTGGGSSRRYQIRLDRLTPCAHATPCADARGGTHASPPLAPMQGHPLHSYASRTVIDTSKTRQKVGDTPPVSSKAADTCPYQQIIDLYHEAMPNNPRCKVVSKARKAAIKSRWSEAATLSCKPFGYSSREDGLKAWRTFFEICAESDFLTGQVPGTNGRPSFVANIDFLMGPEHFAQILENKYHRASEPGAGRPAPAVASQDAIFRGCI